MAVKKNTLKKKSFKMHDLIVDLTDCTSALDVYTKFCTTKIEKYMIEEELDAFVKNNMVCVVSICDCCPETKKPNIFKRFWNWITRKK